MREGGLREEVARVFGPRALAWGLFYEHPDALRFELSTGGGRLAQFARAWDRGREILDAVLGDVPRVTAVVSWVGAGRPDGYLAVFRALRELEVRPGRPREAWREEEDGEVRGFVAFRADRDAVTRLLWGALAADLGVRPRLECGVYLAAPERGVLAHPYDDRGMDVVGPNRALLGDLYRRFPADLLDHDRARMDARFGGQTSRPCGLRPPPPAR